MAHAPREKAMSHFKRFADLMTRFRDDVEFVRTVARAACRAADPIKAAEAFIAKYDAVVAELTSTGVESSIARSLAAIASLSAEPLSTARKLLQNFEAVLALAKETHPQVARSIALSACRATEPLRSGTPVHEQLRHDHSSDRRDGSSTSTCRRLSSVSIGQSVAMGEALSGGTSGGRIGPSTTAGASQSEQQHGTQHTLVAPTGATRTPVCRRGHEATLATP